VLFVGADFERKGGDLLLQIALQKEFVGCDFQFVTTTYRGSTPANVFIHSGVRPNSPELVDLYRRADIFVLPSHADFSPYAVVEAMATGLPVVTTSVGALAEIVLDGKTGFVVPPGDVPLLKDRVLRLCGNLELRQQMGRLGRTIVEARHDLAKNGETIIELLKGLAHRTCAGEQQP
jgi:glycosyltransferase involved in cell wall biosynthesis